MPVFATAEDLYGTIGAFLTEVVGSPEVGPKFSAAQTSFHITYSEPAGEILIDCQSNPPTVTCGGGTKGEIELRMSADDGHQFWLGKLNIQMALIGGKVKVEGPVSKIMRLLPAVRPVFPRYREFLMERDRQDLTR